MQAMNKKPAKDKPLLSLVVPFHNEEGNLAMFFERASKTLASLDVRWELIFVNDGSLDNSLKEAVALYEQHDEVNVIDLSRNFGKEIALSAGLDHARGDAIIEIDADLEHPPEVIADLVEKWNEGYQIVFATRKSRTVEPFLKRVSARAYYKIFGWLSKIPNHDKLGDFCLLDRCVVDKLTAFPEHNRFMKGLVAWTGFKQGFVSYELGSRTAGETKWNYWRLWNFALEGITSFSSIPLKLWTYVGVVIAFLAFIYTVIIVTRTIIFGIDVPGYASLLTIVLFLGGVQLIGLGVLGEYIGRIYTEVKDRPLYIVQKAYGFESETGEDAAVGAAADKKRSARST
jgi:glycosyltransferase involved in cell wall biosynthesis